MALSRHLPHSDPVPVYVDPGPGSTVLSAKPVTVPSPRERGQDLQVRVSAPATGDRLPIILFSHGYGSSLNGYGPLTDFWAAHGFVVLQPTFLDSRTVGVPTSDPRVPDFWRRPRPTAPSWMAVGGARPRSGLPDRPETG